MAGLGVCLGLLGLRCTQLEGASDYFDGAANTGGQANASTGGVSSSSGGPGLGGSTSKGGSGGASILGGASNLGSGASNGAVTGGQSPVSAGGSGGGASTACPPLAERVRIELSGPNGLDITENTVWSCQNLYVLKGAVFVGNGTTLRIEAGSRIHGENPQAFLLATRGARIEATGTEQAPIVLTSAKNAGSRAAGDWRGLVLIGASRTNQPANSTVFDTVSDARALYGGGPTAQTSGSCGILNYVRVEFAGGNIGDNAFPAAGLTLAGCGNETVVENVQVHRSRDGIGIFGGAVPLKYAVVTGAQDDGIEWVSGYTGSLQYLIVQMYGAFSSALSSNNSESNPAADPASGPSIFNATLVGDRGSLLSSDQETGLAFAFGGGGVMRNSVVLGFKKWAVDVASPPSIDLALSGKLDVSHSIFFGNGNPDPFPGVVDEAFDESAFFTDPNRKNRIVDPQLTRPNDTTAPDFAPTSSEVEQLPAPVPTDLDSLAAFRGALPVQGLGAVDWTQGWTSFPAN